MTKHLFFKSIKYIASATLLLASIACNNNPDEAVDETKNKLHEDPARMEIILTEVKTPQNWNNIKATGIIDYRL